MGKLVKTNLNTHNAKQFVESITEAANSTYYVYVGRHIPFTESSTPTANNSEESSFYDQYRNMIYGKNVTNNDVSHMVKNNAWANNGTVYTQYDHREGDLQNKRFFAVAEQTDGSFGVFKCLSNNKGAVSTAKPTVDDTSANDDLYITTADKYQWKFLYSLTASEHAKFSTSDLVPLKIDTDVTGNAVSGAIDVVAVNSGGTRYNSVANGIIKDAAVGGNNLILEIESLVSANVTIDQSDANNSGTFVVEKLQLFDEVGSTAQANTSNNVANGIIVAANSSVLKVVDLAGDFFGQTSNVIIKGASSGATAKISSVLSDTSSISSNTDFYKRSMLFIADGTGKGQAKEIDEYIVTGSARRVLLNSAFTTQPDTTSRFEISPKVTITGDGSGAEGRAVVNTVNFSVDTIEVTNRGSGYTFASAIVEGNTGIVGANGSTDAANTANVTPIIGPKGGHGADPINELYADTVGVSVNFVDDEEVSGAGQMPAVNDFRTVGILKDPLFANVVITMNTATSNDGTSFTANEIVTQSTNATHGGGSGRITASDTSTLNLTNVSGQFVSGLRITGGTSGVTGNVHSFKTSDKDGSSFNIFDQRLRLTGFDKQTSGNFTIDEVVKQPDTGANGVLHHINSSSIAALTQVKGNFLASDDSEDFEVEGVTSAQRFKFTGKAGPDLVKNSGEILYVENLSDAITRDNTQTETIKVMIKF